MKTKYQEGVEKLTQMEDLLIRLEHGNATHTVVVAIARAVWWLLERWVREHEPQH